MLKYLLFIILGIIIFILLNNVNRFSIGVPYETETRTFFNPDMSPMYTPQEVECIKWQSESTPVARDAPLVIAHPLTFFKTDTLPPIYLGKFRKDPEPGSMFGLGWRHFFIIDKKLYYFEQITVSGQVVLKPKNYGNRGREPIILIDDSSQADLKVTPSRYFSSPYLTVTGTDDRVINMYNDIANVELAKNIIEEYTELVRTTEGAGSVTSCSVDIDSTGIILMSNLKALLETALIDAPRYSIDLRDIPTLCDNYKSVINLNLSEVKESDVSNDILVSNTFDKSRLPVFEYNGIRLIYNTHISTGGLGSVLVVSSIPYSDFNIAAEGGKVAVALILKLYNKKGEMFEARSGQNDPEISLIESLNRQEIKLKDCLGQGEIVGARIIETESLGKVAIMTIMDNNMLNMVRNAANYNVSNTSLFGEGYPSERTLPFEIIRRICKILLCIEGAGYSYTDLKLENILYKCYRNRQLLITMGDLGGINEYSEDFVDPAWTNIAPFNESGFNTHNAVVWIFGLVIIELYKIVIWEDSGEVPIRLKILNPREGEYGYFKSGNSGYFDGVPNAVKYLMNFFDMTIKNGQNDTEIKFIKGLLGRIFVSAVKADGTRQRINLKEMHDLLEGYEG